MKKSFLPAMLLGALIVVLLAVTGCAPDGNGNGNGNGNGPVEGDPDEANNEQVESDPNGNENGEDPDETADNDSVDPDTPGDALLYFGKTAPEIISELGEPLEIDFYEGSEFYYYEKPRLAVFFWPATPGDDEIVRAVSLLEDWSVAGVSDGMTVSQIKHILGEPFDEEMDDRYMLVIDYDKFRFFFYSDSKTEPVTNVLIRYLDDC